MPGSFAKRDCATKIAPTSSPARAVVSHSQLIELGGGRLEGRPQALRLSRWIGGMTGIGKDRGSVGGSGRVDPQRPPDSDAG